MSVGWGGHFPPFSWGFWGRGGDYWWDLGVSAPLTPFLCLFREEDPDDVPHGHITSLVGRGDCEGFENRSEGFGGLLEGL